MSNLHSSILGGSQKHALNVNAVSKNSICQQHVSNADTNLMSISVSDTMHKSPVRKQSLLCSKNLNSNNLIDSVKISTYEDCTSKDTVKKMVTINNSNTKNAIILEKVRSKLNTYKGSYGNKQRKSLSQANSEEVSEYCEETNLTNSSFLKN